jgi:hypothetical protein
MWHVLCHDILQPVAQIMRVGTCNSNMHLTDLQHASEPSHISFVEAHSAASQGPLQW